MAEHGRLGRAGGAAGEQQRSEVVVGLLGDRGRRHLLAQRIEVDAACQLAARRHQQVLQGGHRGAVELGQRSDPGRPADHRLGPHRRQLAGDLGGGALRVERRGHHARAQDAEPGPHEAEVGGAHDAHHVAGLEPERAQHASGLGHLVAQPPV